MTFILAFFERQVGLKKNLFQHFYSVHKIFACLCDALVLKHFRPGVETKPEANDEEEDLLWRPMQRERRRRENKNFVQTLEIV